MRPIVFSYAGADRYTGKVRAHTHLGYELLYVQEGRCTIQFDRQAPVAGSEGIIFLIPPKVEHRRFSQAACETYYAVFDTTLTDIPSVPLAVDTNRDALVVEWMRDLKTLGLANEKEQAAVLVEALLLRLHAIRHHNEASAEMHPVLSKACEYLRVNCEKAFSMRELARRCGASQSHLNALFRHAFDKGPLQILTENRMKLARQLLADHSLNVTEVAERAGFRNVFYFSRCFRNWHGIPPMEYRRNPRKSYSPDTEAPE